MEILAKGSNKFEAAAALLARKSQPAPLSRMTLPYFAPLDSNPDLNFGGKQNPNKDAANSCCYKVQSSRA
uniref:Uncharacterized protein n=1 Tax=Solanum lycopersicum TaxID=4081 RepID=A0A3Q7ESW7_SOLLC